MPSENIATFLSKLKATLGSLTQTLQNSLLLAALGLWLVISTELVSKLVELA